MEEKIPDIEILGSNFRKMDEKMFFMKEQFSKFEKNEKLNINFKKCHIAISPNGGYIAICKKKNFEDEDEFFLGVDKSINEKRFIYYYKMDINEIKNFMEVY